MFIKFIIFLIAAYFVIKIFKSQLMPKRDNTKVKSEKSESTKKRSIDEKKIEDADFEEIE
jgi:hypothetical protein